MIKICTGWGNSGGSTTAFINLVNLFNDNNIDATLYGPKHHLWHLDKCKSDTLDNFKPTKDDSVIVHFMNIPNRINCKKLILSSHEHEIFPVKNTKYKIFDKIHYVSEHQKDWHKVYHPSIIIPNVLNNLKPRIKPNIKIGGVIGSIDRNKQTHISIQKALEDGCDKVNLYGMISDQSYFDSKIKPLLNETVVFVGYCNNKQYMWDSITDVYHYSKMETWSFLKGESELTGTKLHSNGSIKDDIEIWDNNKILDTWKEELSL